MFTCFIDVLVVRSRDAGGRVRAGLYFYFLSSVRVGGDGGGRVLWQVRKSNKNYTLASTDFLLCSAGIADVRAPRQA